MSAKSASVRALFVLTAIAAALVVLLSWGNAQAFADSGAGGATVGDGNAGGMHYTVKLTYGDKQYVMQGNTTVPLEDILATIGLSGQVSAAETNKPKIFSVQLQDGVWTATAHKPFHDPVSMYVTVDGVQHLVAVTDAEHTFYDETLTEAIWVLPDLADMVFLCTNGQTYTLSARGDLVSWSEGDYDAWDLTVEENGNLTLYAAANRDETPTYKWTKQLTGGNNAWVVGVAQRAFSSDTAWREIQTRLNTPTFDPASTKIQYDGNPHALLVSSTGDSGRRHYSYQKDGGSWSDWSTDVPTATEIGTYNVRWYSDYHYTSRTSANNWLKKGSADSPAGTFTTQIVPYTATAPSLTGWSGPYDGSAHSVVATGAAGGTVHYRTSTDNNNWSDWSAEAPTRTDAGITYVQAYTKGNDDYADSGVTETAQINVAKADPVAEAPTGTAATYGQTLADVELRNPSGNTPGAWAWADSSVSVGSAGERTFKANFTPNDAANYNAKSNVDVTVTVGKASNLASVRGTASVVKGGKTVDLAGNVAKNGAEGAVTYEIAGDALGCALDGSVLTSGGSVGTVTVTVTVAGDANHDALVAPIEVTVMDKPSQTIAAKDVQATYGDSGARISARVTSPATDGGAISYAVRAGSEDYLEVDAASGALTVKKVPADGKAYVDVIAAEISDYGRTTKVVVVTVNKADIAVTVAANHRTTDGVERPLVSVASSDPLGGTISFALGTSASLAPDASAYTTTVPSAKTVGTYYVWYKIAGDENHNNVAPACVTVNVMEPGAWDPAVQSYTISSAEEWDAFASLVNNGNAFSGVTVKLADDITVTTMAGTSNNKFKGTFDGDGHTLTFNCTTSESFAAPFRYVESATFRNLTVVGTIATSNNQAAGFVAHSSGDTSFASCRSKVIIDSSRDGNGTHGGLVATADGTVSFTDCLFDGQIKGDLTSACGGFVGWSGANRLSLVNCLNAGDFATKQEGGTFTDCGTFSRTDNPYSITTDNSYYKAAYGTEQGAQTNETGETLRAMLGDGWTVDGDDVIPGIADLQTESAPGEMEIVRFAGVDWVVLDSSHANGYATEAEYDAGGQRSSGMFLIAKNILGNAYFKKDKTSNAYSGSDVQKWCTDFYANQISALDKTAVLGVKTKGDPNNNIDGMSGDADKVFILSQTEYNSFRVRIPVLQNDWWIRTKPESSGSAQFVSDNGEIYSEVIQFTKYVRPALNLNLDRIVYFENPDYAQDSSQPKWIIKSGDEALAEAKADLQATIDSAKVARDYVAKGYTNDSKQVVTDAVAEGQACVDADHSPATAAEIKAVLAEIAQKKTAIEDAVADLTVENYMIPGTAYTVKAGDEIRAVGVDLSESAAAGKAYLGNPMFRVLKVEDGRMLLMSEYLWAGGKGSNSFGMVGFGSGNAWQGSTAQAWAAAFGEDILGQIPGLALKKVPGSVTDKAYTPADGQASSAFSYAESEGILTAADEVFFLSGEEALEFMKTNEERAAKLYDADAAGDASYWWLRSTVQDGAEVGYVAVSGLAAKKTPTLRSYLRPAFWVTIPDIDPAIMSRTIEDVEGTTRTVYTITLHEHEWGEPTYTWANDHKSVTAKRVCAADSTHVEEETAEATGKVTKQPTCKAKGQTTYTSAAFENEAFAVQAKTVEDVDVVEHDWSVFEAQGATVTARCGVCGEAGPTLAIAAPTLKTYGQEGEGVSADAVITTTGDADIQGDAKVVYYMADEFDEKTGDALEGAPTGAGSYRAEITLGKGENAATAFVVYAIAKAVPVVTAPEAVATYGQRLGSVELANPEGNLPGTWAWEDAGQTVGNAGTNSFKATFKPDDAANYEAVAGVDVTVTVGKRPVAAPAIEGRTYTGGPQVASVPASALYDVTKNDGGTDVGEYDVVLSLVDAGSYKWEGTDEADVTLKFRITPAAAPAVAAPAPAAVAYDPDKTLADVALPEGWAWAAPETVPTVGNAGYDAVLAVDDRNYDYAGVEGYDAQAHAVTRTVRLAVEKAVVDAPAIAAKVHNGDAQVADVPESAYYAVTLNGGGKDVGEYDVVLTLTDTANCKWAGTDNASIVLKFQIVPEKVNVVTVRLEGWTYGEAPNEPEATATYGASTVAYSYAGSEAGPFSPEVPSDAGVWYVRARVEAGVDAGGEGYPAGEATASFQIARAASVPALVSAGMRAYDGTERPLVTADASTLAGGEMRYALSGGATVVPADGEFGEGVPSATDAGTYYVWCKVEPDANHADFGPTCVAVTVARADWAVAAPEPADPAYSGEEQALVRAGSAEGGAMQYSLDGEAWSGEVPAATAAGDYDVWYRVEGDANHNGYGPARVAAAIIKAPPVVAAPEPTDPAYSGKEQALVRAGSAEGGTMQYSLDGKAWSEEVPAAAAAKSYDVWYRVEGDANHLDAAPQRVTSTIRKPANPIAARAKAETQQVTHSAGSGQALAANVAVSGARGKVTYSNASAAAGARGLKVDAATGAVTVPKGTAAGTYAVTVRAAAAGDADHEAGSKDVSFKVVVKAATFALAAPATQAWTGGAVKARPIVKSGGVTLREGTDYTLAWKDNVGAGTATVTATGKGNYTGVKSAKFRIAKPSVQYYVSRQTYGDERAWSRADGQVSGTTGQSKRLEALRVRLANRPVSGSIKYRVHVQTYGWETGWRMDGATSGTTGQSKRLEAVQIQLTGEMAKRYDVYYRVHAQRFGWMGWAKNGQSAGTAGHAFRLEAIQIALVPKGAKAPAAAYRGARQATRAAFVQR